MASLLALARNRPPPNAAQTAARAARRRGTYHGGSDTPLNRRQAAGTCRLAAKAKAKSRGPRAAGPAEAIADAWNQGVQSRVREEIAADGSGLADRQAGVDGRVWCTSKVLRSVFSENVSANIQNTPGLFEMMESSLHQVDCAHIVADTVLATQAKYISAFYENNVGWTAVQWEFDSTPQQVPGTNSVDSVYTRIKSMFVFIGFCLAGCEIYTALIPKMLHLT